MPTLQALAKRLKPQADRVESGASKAELKRAHEQEQEGEGTTKSFGLGARIESRLKKARFRVQQTHSERIEPLLKQYEDFAVQEGEEEGTRRVQWPGRQSQGFAVEEKNPGVGTFRFRWLWISGSEGHGSRKNALDMGAKVTGSRPKEVSARELDSKFSSGEVRSKGTLMGAQGPGSGNRDTSPVLSESLATESQEPIESWNKE